MIGERVRRLRQARGWSQVQLANYAGLLQSRLSQIESGERQNIGSEAIVKLARALGTTADYLLGLTDDPRGREEGIALDEVEAMIIRKLRELPSDDDRRVVFRIVCTMAERYQEDDARITQKLITMIEEVMEAEDPDRTLWLLDAALAAGILSEELHEQLTQRIEAERGGVRAVRPQPETSTIGAHPE